MQAFHIVHGDMEQETERVRMVYAFLTTPMLVNAEVTVCPKDAQSLEDMVRMTYRGDTISYKTLRDVFAQEKTALYAVASLDVYDERRVMMTAVGDETLKYYGASSDTGIALTMMDDILSDAEFTRLMNEIYKRYDELLATDA